MQGGKSLPASDMYAHSWFPFLALSLLGLWSQTWTHLLVLSRSSAHPRDPLLGLLKAVTSLGQRRGGGDRQGGCLHLTQSMRAHWCLRLQREDKAVAERISQEL